MSQTRMDLQFKGRMKSMHLYYEVSYAKKILNQCQAKRFRSENHPHLSALRPLDIDKRRINGLPSILYHLDDCIHTLYKHQGQGVM